MDKEYKPLTIPKISWDKKTLTEKYGEVVAQPLEPGFGMTIGNALRRLLLGSVEGSAVTSFILKGTNNEFATVPGIMQDTMQIALNIKGIVVHNTHGISGVMRLHKKGPGAVTAGDLSTDAHLSIINKDHIIAHLADDGEFDAEFFVSSGRGYHQAQWPTDKAYQEDGRIYIDAMFSPIVKVMFDVEKTRVGNEIDFDKLIMQISTNGSLTPIEAMNYAVSVIRSQLEHFLTDAEIPFNVLVPPVAPIPEVKPVAQVEETTTNTLSSSLLLSPIDVLDLPVRARNCLLAAGVKRVIDVVNLTSDDVLKIKNFGSKSLNEVKEILEAAHLSFNMNIKEEDVQNVLPVEE